MMKILNQIWVTLFIITYSCAQNKTPELEAKTINESSVDYSKASNIIKEPEKLTGDERAIFYNPYFLKLTHKEAQNLSPKEIKKEFEKMGITTNYRDRFNNALTFYDVTLINHKKSIENWESFKDLAPKTQN